MSWSPTTDAGGYRGSLLNGSGCIRDSMVCSLLAPPLLWVTYGGVVVLWSWWMLMFAVVAVRSFGGGGGDVLHYDLGLGLGFSWGWA